MTSCVILHNMIIESGNFQCLKMNCINGWVLLQMLITMCLLHFDAFLARHQEARDSNTHHQLQDDLVEHLWILKGGV
jgi:hypothetical protein